MFFVDFTPQLKKNTTPKVSLIWLVLWVSAGLLPLSAQARGNVLIAEIDDLETYHGYFFKAGSEIQTKVIGATEQEFMSLRNQHFYSGLGMIDLEIMPEEDGLIISAIFEPRTGNEDFTLGQPWSDFQALNADRQDSGMVLSDIETYEQNGMRMFAGVWRSAAAPDQILPTPANATTFHSNLQLLGNQGYVLTDLEVFESLGRPVFVGVFDFLAETTIVLTDMDWNEFHAKFHELNDDSYRLVDFESYVIDGAAYYAGVWQPGTQGDKLAVVDPDWNMGPIETDVTIEGLTLIDFEIIREHPDKQSPHEAPNPLGVSTKMGLVNPGGPVGTLMPLHNGSSSGPGN